MRFPLLLALPLLAACVEEPVSGSAAFMEDCALCHGSDAKGSGPIANDLDVKPADLTRIAARNGGIFPRDEVMSRIDGYGLDGGVMPEFGAGDMGDTVVVEGEDGLGTPVPARLLALTDYLQSLQQ